MKKLIMLLVLALAVSFGLAQMQAEATLQEAVATIPEDARVALYSTETQELVGYSPNFTRTDFQLTLAQDFTGPAILVVEHTDGTVQTFNVEVADGAIMSEETAFLDILTQAGFANAQVVGQELDEQMVADAPVLPEGAIEAGGGGEVPAEGEDAGEGDDAGDGEGEEDGAGDGEGDGEGEAD